MSTSRVEYWARHVSSHDNNDLLVRIDELIKQLQTKPEVKSMRVVSVSHAVIVQHDGSFLWSAIIMCEVEVDV